MEAVVYHTGNESGLIGCIPETAMIHCLLLARDQPLNNVYHCLPGLFNYPANVIDAASRGPRLLWFFFCLRWCRVTIHLRRYKPFFQWKSDPYAHFGYNSTTLICLERCPGYETQVKNTGWRRGGGFQEIWGAFRFCTKTLCNATVTRSWMSCVECNSLPHFILNHADSLGSQTESISKIIA